MLTNTHILTLLAEISDQPSLPMNEPFENLSNCLKANITIVDNSGAIFFTSKNKITTHKNNSIFPVIHKGKIWGQFIINKSKLTERDLTGIEMLLSLFSLQLP